MGLFDRVADAVGMPVPPPRLRVVGEDERAPTTAESRAARPGALGEFIGQETVVFNVGVAVKAARRRGRLPDHMLFEGPPGLGKTSLAGCVAAELGVRFVEVPASSLDKVTAVAEGLARIGEPEDGPAVVFVDEIHGVCKKGQLLFLAALDEGRFQPSGWAEPFFLAEFCLIGATTNPGLLSRAFRRRFMVQEELSFYEAADLERVVARYADEQGIRLGEGAAARLAAVGRGTPADTITRFRRVSDFVEVAGEESITEDAAVESLAHLGIDEFGMDARDRRLLEALRGQSRPIGLSALAQLLGTDNDSVSERKPFLLRIGALACGGRGHVLTRKGHRMLGHTAPVWVPSP